MKRFEKLLITLFTSLFLYTSAYGDSYDFDVDSLLGFEGGYTSFDVDQQQIGQPLKTKTNDTAEAALKIGAQSKDFRIFLSIRNYFAEDYDYLATAGLELDYLFNISNSLNFFIGINGGLMKGKLKVDGANSASYIDDKYYGAQAGFTYHINKTYDFELGFRAINTDAEDTSNGVKYTYDKFYTGYGSLNIKFKLD